MHLLIWLGNMKSRHLFHLITQILSLRVFPERVPEVALHFPTEKDEWQRWVQIGSRHLVLQSLYVTLRKANLLSNLPPDLVEYLEYIHRLNFERNESIKSQAVEINQLFSEAGIGCIFMKGTGNLFDSLYSDPGERMLYDIDILVEKNRMLEAAERLMANGYRTQKPFNPKALASTMHYPILVKEGCVAGVELHQNAVRHQYLKSFSTEMVFSSKKGSLTNESIFVMSDSNKIIHNFIHSQLMHNAHYHADVLLRNLFDLLLLGERETLNETFSEFGFYRRKALAYFFLMSKVFGLSNSGATQSFTSKLLVFRHGFTINLSNKQRSFYHFLITFFIKYIALPFRTIFDRSARNYVFSRLRNPKWYGQHFKAYKRKFTGNRKIN